MKSVKDVPFGGFVVFYIYINSDNYGDDDIIIISSSNNQDDVYSAVNMCSFGRSNECSLVPTAKWLLTSDPVSDWPL